MTRKRPNFTRVTLMKMAHATRTFWTQAEALEFITERQKNENNVNIENIGNIFIYVFLFR